MIRIDLNCDLGEGAGSDAALMQYISSANIACGAHAGDEAAIRETARAAKQRGVAIGAHPGYPDRSNFGRIDLAMEPEAIRATVVEQAALVRRIAHEEGARVGHVKPHGALYHAAMSKRPIAEAIAAAARSIDPGLILVGLAGSACLDWWRSAGLRVAAEGFADRRYERDGTLRSRLRAGAILEGPDAAAEQALRLAEGRGAVTDEGSVVNIAVDTICIHGDAAGAVGIARAVRELLTKRGIEVRALV